MADNEFHVLYCIVDGDNEPIKVRVHKNEDITDLKKHILEDVDTPYQVRSRRLTLWKLHESIPVGDRVDHLRNLGTDFAQFAVKLTEPASKVSYWFPEVTLDDHLYIIVIVPPPSTGITPSSSTESKFSESAISEFGQHPIKRGRSQEELDPDIVSLHKNFWQRGQQLLVKRSVQIPDPWSLEVENGSEPLSLTIIEHPEGPKRLFPFGLSKLLVVEIYETFLDLLESEEQEWQELLRKPYLDRFSSLCHATIITGQPGIGKTVFLTYVLLRRLVDGLTTIYCDEPQHAYIFDGTGVRRVDISNPHRIPELDVDSRCCALVNLGDGLTSVPRVFYPKRRKGRVVLASSPDKSYWHNFSHEHMAETYCMPTWSWGPLYICSLLFAGIDYSKKQLDMDHCKRLRKAYSLFRGIPRLCFQSLTPKGLAHQWTFIQDALSEINSMGDFIQATKNQLPFESNTSHRLVRVEPMDDSWFATRTELLSERIAELVFERIRIVTRARLSETLLDQLADPYSHGKAGCLFEHAAHFVIRRGLTLAIAPLSSDSKTEDSIPVPTVGDNEKSRYFFLDIREKSGSQKVHKDCLGLYMTPISKSEASIDALFISQAYTTYLFQMTVSKHHPIKFQGLDTVVSKLPAKAQKDIRFVFVIPARGVSGEAYQGIESTQSIAAPQGANMAKCEQFQRFPQYVCQLDIDAAGSRS